MLIQATISGEVSPIILPTAIIRRFTSHSNLIFSGPSITQSSELSGTESVLEFPQITVSAGVILSTEGNNVLVTRRNENFDDQIIL